MNISEAHTHIDSVLMKIAGQTERPSMYLTAAILDAQHAPGNLVEIGLFGGRYFSLMGLFRQPNEKLIGLDNFIILPRKQMEANVLRALGSLKGIEIIEGASRDVDAGTLGDVRFASVDGSHTLRDALKDLRLVDAAGGDDLIVAYDDFFNANFPGVTEAYFRYAARKDVRLAPFTYCRNKLFLCRPDRHEHYFELMRSSILDSATELALAKPPTWALRGGDPWLRQKIADFDTWIIR